MKNTIKKIVNKLGYKIERLERVRGSDNPYSQYSKLKTNILDMKKLGKMSLTIPGMVTPDQESFYMRCVTCKISKEM